MHLEKIENKDDLINFLTKIVRDEFNFEDAKASIKLDEEEDDEYKNTPYRVPWPASNATDERPQTHIFSIKIKGANGVLTEVVASDHCVKEDILNNLSEARIDSISNTFDSIFNFASVKDFIEYNIEDLRIFNPYKIQRLANRHFDDAYLYKSISLNIVLNIVFDFCIKNSLSSENLRNNNLLKENLREWSYYPILLEFYPVIARIKFFQRYLDLYEMNFPTEYHKEMKRMYERKVDSLKKTKRKQVEGDQKAAKVNTVTIDHDFKIIMLSHLLFPEACRAISFERLINKFEENNIIRSGADLKTFEKRKQLLM